MFVAFILAKGQSMSTRPLTVVLMVLLTHALANAQSTMEITTTIDLGPDRGQNFGTVFEARDADGKLVAGAGFAGVYNTRFRHDRHTLQFFIRPRNAADDFDVQTLPRPNADRGVYMLDYNGRLYAASHFSDRMFRWWDEASGQWVDDPTFGSEAHGSGDLVMLVAGRELRGINSQVHYDGKLLLDRPGVGHYHHFYYAAGHLVFFHNNRGGDPAFSRLYACKWDPESNQPLDLDNAAVLDVTFPGETPFAIGQLNGKIVNSSNMGGVYLLDDGAWRVLVEPDDKTSYQLYSMLNWHDKLLMAHYPSGHLFEFDGQAIRELEGWPPRMEGVSGSAREAQTTCLFGGDIHVGVWPWAELWRRDESSGDWSFLRRMFERPELTAAVNHPWEQEVRDYNQAHGKEIVANNWGHRVTGLVPLGGSLYVSTSAKAPWPAKDRLDFLTDEVWEEYGRVYRLTPRQGGIISAPIEWKNGPTTLTFTVTASGKMTVSQDGRLLGEATAALDGDWTITWSDGVFGPLGGSMTDQQVQ